MAQQPAVLIIARHGPRLDGADQSWHLSTPTPYDPPLTYGGWNQSQTLGTRIASVLNAREKAAEERFQEDQNAILGVNAQDFGRNRQTTRSTNSSGGATPVKGSTKRIRHRVVIHTSPFLRCVQTSVAIAAGMAQYQPAVMDSGAASRPRTPASLHSASPKIKAQDHIRSSSYLAPISEPRPLISIPNDHGNSSARVKLRVDAFLGEWLNPQYFDQITPPPPSPMMVATAKAELLSKDRIDAYTPTISSKSSHSTLWGGSVGRAADESAIDDMSALQQALPTTSTLRRERASSVSSAGSSTDSESSRSQWRAGHFSRASWSSVPASTLTAYQPPKPHYAVSSSDKIPRGYVSHARSSCVDVDYNWDSSRPPRSWTDGGVYGEEWSSMHKRFRKGLNHLVEWYSTNDVDALQTDNGTSNGLNSAEHTQATAVDDDVQEELVIVLVTHGAGCNALIGALTGQPVLLDVGMASLTMATRREDTSSSNGVAKSGGKNDSWSRRPTTDLALSTLYEMKLVSSSEHLRSDSSTRPQVGLSRSSLPAFVENSWHREPPARRGTSTAVGSIRRPSAVNLFAPRPDFPERSESAPAPQSLDAKEVGSRTSPPVTHGLWTPPASRTPVVIPQDNPLSAVQNAQPNEESPSPQSLPPLPDRQVSPATQSNIDEDKPLPPRASVPPRSMALALNHAFDSAKVPYLVESPVEQFNEKRGSISDLPRANDELPQQLRRGLSQKGLWGARPGGDRPERHFGQEPKRRWTVTRNAA